MNKKLKLLFFSIIVLFGICLTGCRYDTFLEEKTDIIGETKAFIISQDLEGKYYISGFTNEGLGAKILTIPEYVDIDENQYKISYVDDIFKNHSYVRMLNINIPTDKLSINGSNSIRVVQVSQDNLVNPESFLKGLKNIDIYINDSSYTYEGIDFGKNNVYYGTAPELKNFELLTTYEYISLGITAVGIIIAVIGLALLVIFIKSICVFKYNNITSIACCMGLGIYIIATVVLILIGKENIIFLKGIPFLLPICLAIGSYILKEESSNGFFIISIVSLIVSCVAIIINIIFFESAQLIWAQLLAIVIISGLVTLIKLLHDNIELLFAAVAVITIFAAPASVFLCDLLLDFVLSNLLITILFGIILIAMISVIILYWIKSRNYISIEEKVEIPLPEFNGIFSCNIRLPYNYNWESKPAVYYKEDTIYVLGTIRYAKRVYGDYELKGVLKKCEDVIWESITSIMECYYLEHPNAPRIAVDLSNLIIKAKKIIN